MSQTIVLEELSHASIFHRFAECQDIQLGADVEFPQENGS